MLKYERNYRIALPKIAETRNKRKKELWMARIINGVSQNCTGNNIKRLRKEKGLSQQQLARKLKEIEVFVCRGSISRIESGERTISDIEIVGFSKALDVSISSLFEGFE